MFTKKKVLIQFFLSLAIGLIFALQLSPVSIVRGGNEGVFDLYDGATIEQEIKLKNGNEIYINVLNKLSSDDHYYLNNNSQIRVTIEQGTKSKTYPIDLSAIRTGWSWIFSNTQMSLFDDGFVTVKFSTINIDKDHNIGFLFTSGKQKYSIGNVKYNGKTVSEMFCFLAYDSFSFNSFFVASIFAFVGLSVLSLLFALRHALYSNFIKYFPIYVYVLLLTYNYFSAIYLHYSDIGNDGWISTPWLISYFDYGLVPKAFPGTLLSVFKDHISKHTLFTVFNLSFVFTNVLLCYLFKVIISKVQEDKLLRIIVNSLLILYICSPFSFICYVNTLGRLDILCAMFFIINLITLLRINNRKVQATIIAICSSAAILCHQMYIFCLYPVLFSILLYRVWVQGDKSSILPLVTHVVIPGIVGVVVQFYAKMNLPIDVVIEQLSSNNSAFVLPAMIDADYYLPIHENLFVYGYLDSHTWLRMPQLIIFVFLLSPIMYVYFKVASCMVNVESNRYNRIKQLLILLIPLFATFPWIYVISDVNRIMLLFALEYTALLVVLLVLNWEKVKPVLQHYWGEKDEYELLCVLLILVVYESFFELIYVNSGPYIAAFAQGVMNILVSCY